MKRKWFAHLLAPRSCHAAVGAFGIFLAALSLVGCGTGEATANKVRATVTSTSDYASGQVKAVKVGGGIACEIAGEIGPASYLVRDMGNPAVPLPSAKDLKMLHKIMKYVHPKTLRFAYVGGRFIVYDATAGPCSTGLRYYVLNTEWCGYEYAPTDRPNNILASGECFNAPRPWIPHDAGRGTVPWTKYPNGP